MSPPTLKAGGGQWRLRLPIRAGTSWPDQRAPGRQCFADSSCLELTLRYVGVSDGRDVTRTTWPEHLSDRETD